MTTRRECYDGSQLYDVFDKAAEANDDPNFYNQAVGDRIRRALGDDESGQRLPGSDVQDPRGSAVKPEAKHWTKVPSTDEEKALYFGVHIHSEDNPLGLHTHVPGGDLTGGHTHSPSNPQGVHFHGPELTGTQGRQVDGRHLHEVGENMPGGKHKHLPENFG